VGCAALCRWLEFVWQVCMCVCGCVGVGGCLSMCVCVRVYMLFICVRVCVRRGGEGAGCASVCGLLGAVWEVSMCVCDCEGMGGNCLAGGEFVVVECVWVFV